MMRPITLSLLSAAAATFLWSQSGPDLTISKLDVMGINVNGQTLALSGSLGVTVRNTGGTAVAGAFKLLVFEDRNRNGSHDAGVDVIVGSAQMTGGIPIGAEKSTTIPLGGTVLFKGAPLYVFADSDGIIAESSESNNVSSTAGNSVYIPPTGTLNPFVKWNKREFSVAPDFKQVMCSPAVADLNGDGTPDIVFSTFAGRNYLSGYLRAISGRDGAELWTVIDPRYMALTEDNPAIGDIDGDGLPEIVVLNQDLTLMAFEHDGTFKWKSTVILRSRDYPNENMGATSIADLDGNGTPEIVFGAAVFNGRGELLWKGAQGQGDTYAGQISTVVDLDLDGKQEIVAGNTAYKSNGQVHWTRSLNDGFTAVGNFDADPFPEVVLVSCSNRPGTCVLYLLEHDGSTKWGPMPIPGSDYPGRLAGPPTVADFDGDGKPEIGLAAAGKYSVIETDGSLKWESTVQDYSSSSTGSSVFDFEGDGKAEVIYGDELYLRIYDGTTGRELYKLNKSSGTLTELPTIVDVDGDGHADIVAAANSMTGPENGIFVISGAGGNWVNTRKIWNQQAYSITNVNDDATIPRNPVPNWLQPGLNNFRLNTFTQPGKATSAPDLTSSYIRKNDSLFPASVQLTARVGNGGSSPVSAMTVYRANFEGNVGAEWSNTAVSVAGNGRRFLGRFGNETVSLRLNGVTPNSVLAVSLDVVILDSWDGNANYNSLGPDVWSASVQGGPLLFQTTFSTSDPGSPQENFQTYPNSWPGAANSARTGATLENLGSLGSVYRIRLKVVPLSNSITLNFAAKGLQGLADESWGLDNVIVEAVASGVNGVRVPVAFYRGDPATGGILIGKTETSKALAPGEYEDVSVSWNNPPFGLHSIFVVADDSAQIPEGDESNNKSATQILIGSGPFPLVDELLTRQKNNSVDLSWVSILGATGYNVYRRIGSGTPLLISANQTGISFADTGLTNGVPVYYTVRWRNAQGVESADGTEASGTPTAIGSTGANPPTISSRALTRAIVGQPYSYQFRATDPDAGTVFTSSLVSPPSGMAISKTGLITWVPTIGQAGYSRIHVRVEDNSGRFATQSYSLFSEVQTIINNPPVISSTPVRNATSGTLYAYQVVGNDPDGSFLTWSLDVAPLGLSINQATGLLQWTPTRDQVGTHNVTARVTDIGGLSTTRTFSITVARGNRAPSFNSSALTLARAGELYRYPASASDPDGDPLAYSLLGGPTGMTVNSSSGLLTWTPAANLANTVVLVTLRVVDDGNLAATQAYTLKVAAPNRTPVITSNAITKAVVGSNYLYQVTATDPDLPNDQLTFSLTVAPAGMTINPSSGLIQWTPPANVMNSSQNATVRLADIGGLQATQSFVIQVGAAGSDLPIVSLVSPTNGATLTADTPIIGTVTDPNLRLWRVEYQRTGDTEWFPLSSGTTPVTNGSLGTVPATLIANDAYRLRLYAENAIGSVTTPDIGANVDTKQLKMGDFTLAFEDLRVPGFTFPISILRKYDTKRPQSGDFGRGWTLGFSEVDVRLDASGNVFLTLPDARRVRFTYTPECVSPLFGGCTFGVYKTVFTAQNGVYDTLESQDCATTVFKGCSLGGPFNPQLWLLTTREGLKYTIDSGKITRMEDRSGNWIQIGPAGVTSNTGRNVAFERNAKGLITNIKEPSPGGEMRYEYDAQGRLLRWINLSGKTTTFFYENTEFPHYLTKIVDPLGREALRNVFNAEGRLVAQCDAAADINTLVGCSQFNPQPGTKTFTAIDGRGFKIELMTDDRGNVVKERRFLDTANYLETTRTYDASNATLTERDPEGNVKTFTYDARGNLLTATDPSGSTTRYSYQPHRE